MRVLTQLFTVLWSPRETLAAVAKQPHVLAPLVFLTLFASFDTGIERYKLDPGAMKLREFERGGYADKISESDKAELAENARKYRNYTFGNAIRPLLAVTIIAGIFFFCFGGKEVPFRSFLSVTAYAFIPWIFRPIIIVATIFAVEPTPEVLSRAGSVGPILFLDPDSVSRATYLILSMVDAISFWMLALLVIGYGYLLRGRVGLPVRIASVVGLYCVWSAIFVGIFLALT